MSFVKKAIGGLGKVFNTKKDKSTSSPYAPAIPQINQLLGSNQQIFTEQQPRLNELAGTAYDAFKSLAPAGFGASPFVSGAQTAASQITSGQGLGANPGGATYTRLQQEQNPGLVGLEKLATGTLPSGGSSLGSESPAATLYRLLAGGGGNSALAGLESFVGQTGTRGAGDGTIGTIASGGAIGGGNDAAGYDRSVIAGKFLNQNPGYAQYMKTLNGDYLDGNPYVDKIAAQSGEAARIAANQRFGAAGLGTNLTSAYAGTVAKNVADAEAGIRYTNYNNERGRQLQAGSQADAAFANERGNMEGASGRISDNHNRSQDRALTAAQALSTGSRTDAAQRLQGLEALLAGNQQQIDNRFKSASGLAGLFEGDRASQLAATTALGNLFGQGQQTQLDAARSADQASGDERQRMLAALGLTGQLTDAQYAGINPLLNLLDTSAKIPFYGVNAAAGNLNTLIGQYGTKTGSQTGTGFDTIGKIAGTVATLSDRRLKRAIVRLGEMADGLGVYAWTYLWGGEQQVGVMADEVAGLRPWALGPKVNGFSTVNYGAL